MDGSRRVRATSVLPRYNPPCLFTGHLSTKSNAFCTDSSSLRLTTLQLVKNHMTVHYNKILSAKATVDCSIPVSVSTSIKYADQQRREKLKKELARCEKEYKLNKSIMQNNSKMNSKPLFNSLQKAPNYMINGAEDKISPLPLEGQTLGWDKIKDGALQQSSKRTLCELSTQLSSDSKIYPDEEELLYLNFMENVTDEILKLGLFSNRFLERLFERHIKQNKHHLEEGKMRYLLHGLKVDLGCISEEQPEKQNSFRMLNQLDFQKALISKHTELVSNDDTLIQQERQQFQEALDMLSSMPKDEDKMFSLPGEFLIPVHRFKYSGVTVQQVNDETDLEASTWNENNPRISDSLIDQETSVDVIEGDSDYEKVETSRELCCLNTSLSPSVQFPSVKNGSNHDKELTLKIMEMSIED
ncbi:putative spermatogeneis-associated protein 7 like protein [Cricetulus griseus]|uniref:Spermatogenesis associated 7 n=1 Tax=Cricetulus griseus TaxID=10029 RepID=A0A8C2MKL2_CRIGR|nr:putative spermatogeneis-associated protein 7 like protein [Cricetulus griseus]